MALAAETVTRHELVGLDVEVVAASNPDSIGLSGTVVTETTQTLGIETDGRVAHIPKDGATFEWSLPSGECVRTAGDTLVGRPARRTEQTGDSIWR